MADTDATPGRTRSGRQSTRRAAVATGLLTFVLPITIGLMAQRFDPGQWKWDDWAALSTSVLLGSLFFVLTLILGKSGNRRATAVADAALMTSIGALQMSSKRSFAGADTHALRIAADARAALQQYENAGAKEQESLIETIEDTYSDLAFGTFSRADALPRSVWDQLRHGAKTVAGDARALAKSLDRKSDKQKEQLNQLADHVCFTLSLGIEIRALHKPSLQAKHVTLRCSWDGSRPADQAADAKSENDLIRRERLGCLYRRELTVKKDWDLLLRASTSMACRVVLQDLAGTDEWYAPWYVTDRPPPLRPVGVLFDDLHEAAADDEVKDAPGLERYPIPIRHGSIPAGMRTQAIDNLHNLLRSREIATVCVLVYDVIVDERTTKRLVLDGNHRLAAARALAKKSESEPPAGIGTDVRVIAFVLAEREPIDDLTSDPDKRFPDWKGFSPDIGLLRKTWWPPRWAQITHTPWPTPTTSPGGAETR